MRHDRVVEAGSEDALSAQVRNQRWRKRGIVGGALPTVQW